MASVQHTVTWINIVKKKKKKRINIVSAEKSTKNKSNTRDILSDVENTLWNCDNVWYQNENR